MWLHTAMRSGIMVFSLIFFALSGVISYKALGISRPETEPGRPLKLQLPDATPATGGDMEARAIPGQADHYMRIEEMQAKIANLEEKLAMKQPVPVPRPAERKIQGVSRVVGVIGGGEFLPGSDGLHGMAIKALEGLVVDILAFPELRVIVEGHSERSVARPSVDAYAENMDLSFLRARTVARELEKKGISSGRITVIGYGDTRPVASNDTGEGRAKNRRVEIRLVPEGMEP